MGDGVRDNPPLGDETLHASGLNPGYRLSCLGVNDLVGLEPAFSRELECAAGAYAETGPGFLY
jgi:hypothetical protein